VDTRAEWSISAVSKEFQVSCYAVFQALYENAHLLQLDLQDSSARPEDIAQIAESLRHNWARRRELWELQKLQEKRMAMEPTTGESDSFRVCSDRVSALASSFRLRAEARSSALMVTINTIAHFVQRNNSKF